MQCHVWITLPVPCEVSSIPIHMRMFVVIAAHLHSMQNEFQFHMQEGWFIFIADHFATRNHVLTE